MPQSCNKIWIRAVWSTKYRIKLIHPHYEKQIYSFIAQQFRDMGCPLRIINGMPDHVHCLFLLSPKPSMADIIKQVKGSSSYYINQNKYIDYKFGWQDGYATFSLSESVLQSVFYYIKNQKRHHLKKSFEAENNGNVARLAAGKVCVCLKKALSNLQCLKL